MESCVCTQDVGFIRRKSYLQGKPKLVLVHNKQHLGIINIICLSTNILQKVNFDSRIVEWKLILVQIFRYSADIFIMIQVIANDTDHYCKSTNEKQRKLNHLFF